LTYIYSSLLILYQTQRGWFS